MMSYGVTRPPWVNETGHKPVKLYAYDTAEMLIFNYLKNYHEAMSELHNNMVKLFPPPPQDNMQTSIFMLIKIALSPDHICH